MNQTLMYLEVTIHSTTSSLDTSGWLKNVTKFSCIIVMEDHNQFPFREAHLHDKMPNLKELTVVISQRIILLSKRSFIRDYLVRLEEFVRRVFRIDVRIGLPKNSNMIHISQSACCSSRQD